VELNLRIIEALTGLSTTGFYDIEDADDPVAEIISQNNVGGVVHKHLTVIGLNPAFWERTKWEFALVPSSQSMRLAIAYVLKNMTVKYKNR